MTNTLNIGKTSLKLSNSERQKISEVIIGNRVPHEYFIVQGTGESDFGYHPGAYDIALEKAGGIHNFNHITYSSILPESAVRIKSVPKEYSHGAVLESISAEAGKDIEYPKRLTAGLIISKVFRNGIYLGGLVAEYHGDATKENCKKFLKENMQSMIKRRYGDDVQTKDEFFIESIEPKLKYACAIVILGFISYKCPILNIKED
ncbi:MAG: pyruvoyl-dependent arginine decarboxylase [Candidatus Pacearchaeota archaeon]